MSFEQLHNMDNKLTHKNEMNDLSHQKVPDNLIEEGISVLVYTYMVISPRSFLKPNRRLDESKDDEMIHV